MKRILVGLFLVAFGTAPATAQLDQSPWHLEVEWELGGEESGVFFTSPRDLVIGAGEYLYLSDRRDLEIRMFTKSGEEVRTIGREGQGPGEFSEVTSLLAMPNEGVLAHDRRGGRLAEFDASGRLVRHITLPGISSRLMWLGAYDSATDRIAFLQEAQERDANSPLAHWADLDDEISGGGALAPTEFLDVEDPVYAFTARSILTYLAGSWYRGSDREAVLVVPKYYTGTWVSIPFESGDFGESVVHRVSNESTLPHATKLEISREEMRAAGNKYGNALGSYGRDGVHFADIHNFAHVTLPLKDGGIGIVFSSEESGMDGIWIDAFDQTGLHVGRHSITFDLPIVESGIGPTFLRGSGTDEVYFLYYTEEMVPILGRGKLVEAK